MTGVVIPIVRSRGRSALLFANSLANVMRAFSGSLITILLPMILVFMLPTEIYTVWVLVFGIAAYVVYLDLGLQASIQANVGFRHGAGDLRAAKDVAQSGLRIVGLVCTLCIAASFALSMLLPTLFPKIPANLIAEAQAALPILVVGQVCGLTINVASAYYAGLQRSLEPALVATIGRFASLGATVIAVIFTSDMVILACAFSAPVVLALGYLLYRFALEQPTRVAISSTLIDPRSAFENGAWPLLRYSGPLIYWNICVLIVNGSGLVIIGLYDYEAVAAYSIAAMFAAAVIGVDNAVTSPLLAELSRLVSSSGSKSISSLVQTATRINAVLILGLASVAILIVPKFLEISDVGGADGFGTPLAILVILAAALRLVMTPLTMAFIATGTHRKILVPPMVEALITLGATVLLAMSFGAIGVGLGALIGSIVAIIMTGTWSLASAAITIGTKRELFMRGVFVPMLCWSFSWIGVSLLHDSMFTSMFNTIAMVVIVASAAVLSWFVALTRSDRSMLLSLPQALLRRRAKSV